MQVHALQHVQHRKDMDSPCLRVQQSSACMQLEAQESNLLALQEKLSMMDSSFLDTSLQKGQDTLQQSLNRMQALQAEAAAQEEEQKQQRKRLRSLEASSRQAQVHARLTCFCATSLVMKGCTSGIPAAICALCNSGRYCLTI